MTLTNFRTVWFVTRPQRDPQFFPQALSALQEATNNFHEKWNSNREIQKKYEQVLADRKLKRNNISQDGSGGRTWVAMLRTYSLVYLDDSGRLVLTKVGLALLNNKKVYKNLMKQLLTLQIPNAYFVSSGFRPKYAEGFAIRPIRFLIKLTCHPSLDYYITKEEITFFAMTAKKDNELESVVAKILHFRNSNHENKEIIKQEIAELDHRERSDKGARDFEKANDDVSSTFMIQAGYTELVVYSDSKLFLDEKSKKSGSTLELINTFDKRYPFNSRYQISESRFGESAGLDVDSYKSRWVNKASVASNKNKIDFQIDEMLSDYPYLPGESLDDIIEITSKSFPPKKAKEIALKIYDNTELSDNIDQGFISSYLNQKDPLEFENQSKKILESLGFQTVLHPKPVKKGVQTSIDILIHLDDESIAILDAKNYQKKFALTANLANHMAVEYIPEYDGYEGKRVKHFGYITASKIGGSFNIQKIIDTAQNYNPNLQVSGSMISAKALIGLLDFCIENNIPHTQRKQFLITLLSDSTAYETYSEVASRLSLI